MAKDDWVEVTKLRSTEEPYTRVLLHALHTAKAGSKTQMSWFSALVSIETSPAPSNTRVEQKMHMFNRLWENGKFTWRQHQRHSNWIICLHRL